MTTNYEQLEKLAKLKEQGILTNEEFENEKRKIMENNSHFSDTNGSQNQEQIVLTNLDVIYLKHPPTGVVINCPTGFSWTSLFFGFFVPLFRVDFMWFFLYIFFAIFTFGMFGFIFPFIYNGIFIKAHLKDGFIPADINSSTYLKRNGYIL